MKKLKYYLPFHFLILLVFGILFQYYTPVFTFNFMLWCIALSLVTTALFILTVIRIGFTISSWVMFFFIGTISVHLKNPKNHFDYFKNHVKDQNIIHAKIDKVLKPSKNFNKYYASIQLVNDINSSGNILLNIKKDATTQNNSIDDVIIFKKKIQTVSTPKNPHQFNYKEYLNRQYVYEQIYLYKEDFISYKSNRNSFIGYILKFREKTKYNLAKLDFNTDELSIINALLLGDKNEIPTEIKANYAKAGAIHILAISGLHIGVVLLILTKLLSPLNTIKNGKNIKGIILILLLWMFAVFTGFSASVIRATTMFSFIVIGQYFQKSKVTEHALITSMFFILLCKPLLIFDIGFQLSYLAVFGIVWIQPKLQALIPYKNYFIQKTGQLITVSISAQIAILPLSIFYFHQFPGLFIISNLIIIPFLGILLGLGFLIILLSYIKLVPHILIDFYGSCIRIMNWIISWVANKEGFIFNKLYISFLGLIASYLIIIFCYQTLVYRKTKFFIFLLLSIIAMQLVISFDTYSKYQKKEFIVFDDYKKSLIGIRKGHILYTDTTKIKNNFNPILSYEIAERTLIQHDDISKNIYVFQNNTIIKLDSIGVYPTKNIENPIIILTNNPKINLERLLQHIQPKQIIADGTNYNSNIELWRQTCDKQKTPFHQTRQNGAYILR